MFEFGSEEAIKYGDIISSKLSGQKISKRIDTADLPGGIKYEAKKLGLDWWELLRALEGMCAKGKASEIDDSTYLVA